LGGCLCKIFGGSNVCKFWGGGEQFETLGFQLRVCWIFIDKYVLNNSGKDGFISFWWYTWRHLYLDLLFSVRYRSIEIMHQSILALPIPPRATPGHLHFFSSLSWQFPGVGQEKRGNAPPPGKKKMTNARPQGTLTHL
jgi:hypothetical protein